MTTNLSKSPNRENAQTMLNNFIPNHTYGNNVQNNIGMTTGQNGA
jgi:hypothetical protein